MTRSSSHSINLFTGKMGQFLRAKQGIKTLSFLFLFLGMGVAFNYVSAQDTTMVQVKFVSGENELAGTLILPAGAQNVPVILYLGGTDEYGKIHRYRESFIYENLVSIFPPSGMGIFYYDARGVGASRGNWQRASMQEFAVDAKAAINYLKSRPEIDAARIAVIGHGEDAWVSQIVAAESGRDIKLMASIAGPVFNAENALINEYYNDYICNGADSTTAYQKAKEKAISHENWVSLFPFTKRWRHMKMKLDFNPDAYIKNIRIPALFLFAEQDGMVYHTWSISYLDSLFQSRVPSNFTIETVPGANHYLKVSNRCYEYKEGDIEQSYSFRFKEILRDYIFENI